MTLARGGERYTIGEGVEEHSEFDCSCLSRTAAVGERRHCLPIDPQQILSVIELPEISSCEENCGSSRAESKLVERHWELERCVADRAFGDDADGLYVRLSGQQQTEEEERWASSPCQWVWKVCPKCCDQLKRVGETTVLPRCASENEMKALG